MRMTLKIISKPNYNKFELTFRVASLVAKLK